MFLNNKSNVKLCFYLKKLYKVHKINLKHKEGNNKNKNRNERKKNSGLLFKFANCLLVLYWPVVSEVLATGSTIAFYFLECSTDV